MPIYEYKCQSCLKIGEYLQKVSAPPPDECAFCSKGPLEKKVSLTSFALKGEGWYVTDFRDGKKQKKVDDKPAAAESAAPAADTKPDATAPAASEGKTPQVEAAKPASTPKAEPSKASKEAKSD